jgi:hypothetical protein
MKKLFLSVLVLLLTANVFAEDFTFNAQYPRVVEAGQTFIFNFVVNKRVSKINYPAFGKLQVVGGPNVSSSQSTSVINGKVTSSSEFTYSYYLIAPKPGKYKVASASTTYDGKTFKTKPVTIEVVKSSGNSNTGGRRYNNSKKSNNASISKDNLFVKLSVDKKNVYLNEPIVATIKLFTTLQVTDLKSVKLSEFTGFWAQDLKLKNPSTIVRERHNGKVFNTVVLKKVLIFPQKTGKLKIEPTDITPVIRQRVSTRSRGFFDDFFGTYQNVEKRIRSNSLTINVKELPNKPAEFNGAVGEFRMHSNVNKTKLKTNESISINVEISGVGNLKLVEPVKFQLPEDFEEYDPKLTENINITESGMKGSIKYEHLIIPRHSGEYTIPKAKFVFFNPKTRQFKTLYTKEFKFEIEKGDDENYSTYKPASGVQKEELKKLDTDIRYIKTNVKESLERKHSFWISKFEYFLYYIIALASFFILYFVRRKSIEDSKDVVMVKNKRAQKLAKKRLKTAESHLKDNSKDEFYNELLKAVWGYVSDKFNIPIARVNRDTITEIFDKNEISEKLKAELLKLADDCEFAHFAPDAKGKHTMEYLYKKAEGLIVKLEQNVR